MTALETLELSIQQRRSYSLDLLKPDPVPRELIERCLDAARYAPNHGRTNPCRYVVIRGVSAKQSLARVALEILPQVLEPTQKIITSVQQLILNAPVWVAIGMTPRRSNPMPEWEELAAVSMAAQNIHLMAQAQGLGALWKSGALWTHPELAAYFGWKAPDKLLGLYFFGFPEHDPKPREHPPLEQMVTWQEA